YGKYPLKIPSLAFIKRAKYYHRTVLNQGLGINSFFIVVFSFFICNMSAEKIISDWKKGIFKPVYWLEGEEPFFIDEVMHF
ncbi:hypothetical protein ABTL25_20210, partial [Acinetobacter baumannii]